MSGIFNSIIKSISQGSIVLFDASPIIASEIILNEFIKEEKTSYLVSDRTVDSIKIGMESMSIDMKLVEIIELNEMLDKDKKDKIIEIIQKNHNIYIIIDTFIQFAEDITFIRDLVRHIKESDNLIFLHIPKGSISEQQMNYISYISDVVFRLDSDRIGDEIIIKFVVPKLRRGVPLMRYMRLVMVSDSVFIDTSRDIS